MHFWNQHFFRNFLDFGEFFEMSLQSISRDEQPQEWIEQSWVCMRLTSGLALASECFFKKKEPAPTGQTMVPSWHSMSADQSRLVWCRCMRDGYENFIAKTLRWEIGNDRCWGCCHWKLMRWIGSAVRSVKKAAWLSSREGWENELESAAWEHERHTATPPHRHTY